MTLLIRLSRLVVVGCSTEDVLELDESTFDGVAQAIERTIGSASYSVWFADLELMKKCFAYYRK